jgi:hypothetical protein
MKYTSVVKPMGDFVPDDDTNAAVVQGPEGNAMMIRVPFERRAYILRFLNARISGCTSSTLVNLLR